MSNKNPSFKKVANFFEGRGFYMVLGICVLAIAISGIMMSAERKAQEEQLRLEQELAELDLLPKETEVGGGAVVTVPSTGENLIEFLPDAKPDATKEPEHDPAEAVANPEKVTVKTPVTVFVNPVAGDLINTFSAGELIYDITFGDWRTHNGVDFKCEPGEKVCSIADGKVESIRTDELYGTVVTISHDNGFTSTYYNLMPNVLVSVGDNVAINEVIGGLGDDALFESGEEYHLHVEIAKNGQLIDPVGTLPK